MRINLGMTVKEVKVGQTWYLKSGPKHKILAKVIKRLNSKCWEIEEGADTRMITTDELIREYGLQGDK